VVLSELLKCFICLCIHINEQRHQAQDAQLPTFADETTTSLSQTGSSLRRLWSDLFSIKSGFFKLLVPAVLYTLQNNLQFVAASNLDAATFQVTYQCKILTTALFAVLMLGQSLSAKKWLALVILTAGVACVQIPSGSSTSPAVQGNFVVGTVAVAVACVCSGFAGVYFEKVLKNGQSSSIWIRNIQLSVGCLGIALVGAFVWDGQAIREHGFFQGYNPIVFATVCTQAAGGLIVAVVIKYADNILKGFATSLSIILSTVASIFIFDFVPTIYFLFGSILVFAATYLYSMPDAPKAIEVQDSESSEKNPMLIVEDYDAEKGLGLSVIEKPFRDDSDHSDQESVDGSTPDSISVYEPDDGNMSRNFSPSLISTPTVEKQFLELDHVN
jgi:solute carrier family 35 (UDP-sugar transporter), member A1/2/3